jgi:signal peptidase I
MGSESPNPYAPSAVVTDEGRRQAARAPRWLAALTTVCCSAGMGLYVLGRPRHFVPWAAATAFTFALTVAGGLLEHPALYVGGMVALFGVGIASLVDTLIARPGDTAPTVGRALVIVLAVFAGERAVGYGVKHWLVEAFKVPSGSMIPSLQPGDHVLVKKLSPAIERGRAVVHRYPPDRSVTYLKRIAAVGGDSFELRNGRVVLNGVALSLVASPRPCPPSAEGMPTDDCRIFHETVDRHAYDVMVARGPVSDFGPVTVPAGHVFVLGDNRNNSKDSRAWGFVPVADVLGTVSFVYWTGGADDGDDRWARQP